MNALTNKNSKASQALILISLAVLFIPKVQANAGFWQSIQSIEDAALKHVENLPTGSSGRVVARVKALDQRLKLARCGTPLETFVPSASGSNATRIIGVRCHKPKPWKVYVPISTSVYKSVVVANRPLTKGDTVSADDVRLEERDVSREPNQYLTSLEQLKGHVLRKDVRDQAILGRSALDAQNIVKRGQNVTLMARNRKLNVRMRGEALATAALNERVRVKNLTSKRVVEGVVVSPQVVLVDH